MKSLNSSAARKKRGKKGKEEEGKVFESRRKKTGAIRPSPPHKTSGQLDSLHPITRNLSIIPRRDFSSWNEESIYDFMPPPSRRVNRGLSRPADLELGLISRSVSLKAEHNCEAGRMMAHNSHPFYHREVNVNDSLLLVSSANLTGD